MKAKFSKRLSAYIIDLMFLGAILMIIYYFIPESDKSLELNYQLNNLNESVIKQEISFNNYLDKYADIIYNLDKERLIYNVINLILIFVYFVIVPLITKGITFGKYIMGIKIKPKKEKLTLTALIIRNIIVNGLGYTLLSIILLFIFPSNLYFIVLSILGIIQFLLVITSCFMIIYRKDLRGLEDIFSQTNVVSIKEKVKE